MPAKPRSFSASPEGLKRLNAAKARLGLTNAAIAERAGVSVGTVGRLLQGQRVSFESLRAIANVLGLSIEEFLFGELISADEPQSDEGLAEARQRIQKAIVTGSTKLDLSELELTTVPAELGQLVKLEILELGGNQLTAVPAELGQLVKLSWLDLSDNQLTAVPAELGRLVKLSWLNLCDNQLTAVPAELGQLINLSMLYLHRNQLITVPAELGQLVELILLDLSGNQLTTVPAELGQLVELGALYLHRNQLTTVPEFIYHLPNLEVVSLSENQITTLPEFLKHIPTLERLFLHSNPKLGIPDEILGCTWSDFLMRSATPAKAQDILNYYFRTKSDRQPLNEAKLILVGYGNVGKTSLVDRLVHNKFDPDSRKTEGIQITEWNLRLNGTEDIKLNVWDFGGQEIMHSTHQFFLTERSLYLLVLNGRQSHEDSDAEYWLELIQSFGGSSPVIIVLNKIKDHPFDLNRSALMQKFPNIRDFIQTDFEAEIGIEPLRSAIERETDRLDHLRAPFPASWFTIKTRLTDMQRTLRKNYIPFEEYRSICHQDGETDLGAQDSLAVHLHNLGIALNYKDDPRLRDTHVLSPHWVTNGIYQLLNAHEFSTTEGEIAIASLAQILDRELYPPERHGFLLELMHKFELCFRFPEDETRYLIPDLLGKQQPPEAEAFHPEDCLNFRYEYPVLPEGLLPRFIVRTHVLSPKQLRWRTGVILEFEGNRALVKADRHDRTVTINVEGAVSGRNRLLAIIRSDFERIHSSFRFKPIEQVPIPNHPDVILNYQDLIVMEKEGLREFPAVNNGKVIKLNVQDLLKGVDLDQTRRRRSEFRNQALRLFYSYSHKDEALRDELEVHLKLLERKGLIRPWHDRRIPPGSDWKAELDTNLERADIILLLVSPDFLASDYCYEVEGKSALERHQAKEAIVIPILIRPVNWQSVSFNYLQALPTDLKAVRQWSDRDDAWLNVEQAIEKIVRSRLSR